MSEDPGPSRGATIIARSGRPPLTASATRRLVKDLGRRLGLGNASLSIVYCDDDFMTDLNRRFRGKDAPTDVLSFPADLDDYLGDIVVSQDTVRREARRNRRGAAEETRRRVIHGFLHLLGYDHETDEGEMNLLERLLRRQIGRTR